MTTQSSSRLSKLKIFANSSVGRLLVLVVLIGVAFGGNALAMHFKHDKYAAARQAADTFLGAYTSCDVQTAKKYYVAFQTDAVAVSNYQKQCVKGAISFGYDSPSKYTQKTVKGVQSIDAALLYNASQRGGTASKFIVNMRWNSGSKQWTVSSITAAPASAPDTTATKAS